MSFDGVWSRHRGSAAAIHQLTLCPCFDRIVLLPLIPETRLEESRRASAMHLIKKSVWSVALLTFMEESLMMPEK